VIALFVLQELLLCMGRRFMVVGVVTLCVLQTTVHCAILRVGNPLRFPDSKPNLQNVRISGVEQFTNHYLRSKHIKSPEFKWGDELEYGIFKKSPGQKTYDISLRGAEIREYLAGLESEFKNVDLGCSWQPEYGAWMVEAVPRDPFDGYVADLLTVERSMKLRRQRLHLALRMDEIAPSMSNFPMLGVKSYSHQVCE